MNATSKQEDIWTKIDNEKRLDRRVKLASKIAWSVTGLAVIVYSGIVVKDALRALEFVAVGAYPISKVVETLMPLVAVVGMISLLIAVLATVGVFFRMRTTSLAEIQLRLAALEDLFVNQGEVE